MQESTWDEARMRFVFEPGPPAPELVGNVRCACFSGSEVVLIDTEESGLSAFPGGRLEPGEDWADALARELLEEVGAKADSVEVVGRIHFWSWFETRYRPYLPHPEFHQVVTSAEVELVGSPTNRPDGEHVLSVELLPVDEAIERLHATNAFEAELLSYVAEARRSR